MRVHYDKDEDTLLMSLSKKKVDDSYETENSIVSVDKKGEPVTIELFKASKFLKNLGKVIPKNLQKHVWSSHQIA